LTTEVGFANQDDFFARQILRIFCAESSQGRDKVGSAGESSTRPESAYTSPFGAVIKPGEGREALRKSTMDEVDKGFEDEHHRNKTSSNRYSQRRHRKSVRFAADLGVRNTVSISAKDDGKKERRSVRFDSEIHTINEPSKATECDLDHNHRRQARHCMEQTLPHAGLPEDNEQEEMVDLTQDSDSYQPDQLPMPANHNGEQALPIPELPGNNDQAETVNFESDPNAYPPDGSPDRTNPDIEQALPPPEPPEDPTEQPQNGRTAWLHALTGFFVVANCWGLGNAWGLFQAYYEVSYLHGSTPSSIAWIGSTQLALVFGLGFPVGKLVDMGYFHPIFHTGTCLMVLGVFCSAWCTSLGTLWLIQGLLTGVGMGMLFCSGMTAMMTWFDERKISIAMGFAAAGSCVGGIVYVLLVRNMLVHQGFATTMIVLGSVSAVTMIPANLVFRIRGEHTLSFRKIRGDLANDPTGASTKKPKPLRQTSNTHPFNWRTFLSPSYVLASFGLFFAFMGVYLAFVYMVLYASTVLHLTNKAASNLLIFMLLANLPGRFLPALISDNCIGPLNTIIPSAFLSSAVIFLWVASDDNNRASLTVIACFYGFVSAGVQVLYVATVYSFCVEEETIAADGSREKAYDKTKKKLDVDRIGIRAGGLYTSIGLACLVGTPIGGALISYRTERGMEKPFLGAQVFAGGS
jgi:MFS family permease